VKEGLLPWSAVPVATIALSKSSAAEAWGSVPSRESEARLSCGPQVPARGGAARGYQDKQAAAIALEVETAPIIPSWSPKANALGRSLWRSRETQAKENIGAGFDEITGNKSHNQGCVVNTWANGDKSYVRTQSSATLKDGTIESADGTWSSTGGTGKLKGIKGKGTYEGKGAPDGSVTYDVQGEYELPK
jgi:hypothetical protein